MIAALAQSDDGERGQCLVLVFILDVHETSRILIGDISPACVAQLPLFLSDALLLQILFLLLLDPLFLLFAEYRDVADFSVSSLSCYRSKVDPRSFNRFVLPGNVIFALLGFVSFQ